MIKIIITFLSLCLVIIIATTRFMKITSEAVAQGSTKMDRKSSEQVSGLDDGLEVWVQEGIIEEQDKKN